MSLITLAPVRTHSRFTASTNTGRVSGAGCPLVKRVIASLKIPWRNWVVRKWNKSNDALSNSTRLVSLVISVAMPPIAPASAMATLSVSLPTATTISAEVILIVRPSNSSSSSPSLAVRTIILGWPVGDSSITLSKSKACSGWPESNINWFVISTGAEIDPQPMRAR